MVKKKAKKYVDKTHTWRSKDGRMNELTELYISMMLRTVGLSLVGIFVPIYLYEIGFSPAIIFTYFALMMAQRVPMNMLAGHIVAKIGPKHTIAASTIVNVLFMMVLLTLESQSWPLGLMLFVQSFGTALFFTAYHTDFSKIMHDGHGGKEIAIMTLFQKAGAALGPLLGGLIGSFYDIRLTITLAIFVMMLSLIPLFQTAEPVKVNQKINYKDFRYKPGHMKFLGMLALVNMGLGIMILVWPLYLALTVFQSNTYAGVGMIATISTLTIMATSRYIGQIADSKFVGKLAVLSAVGNVLLGFSRLFVASPIAAAAHGAAYEQTANATINPILKAFYSLADQYPGQRIVFIVASEVFTVILRSATYGFIALLLFSFNDDIAVMKWSVFVAGLFLGFNSLYSRVVQR